jgi:hypothetical protein
VSRSPSDNGPATVESLFRLWGEHAALERLRQQRLDLRRRESAPAKRELLEHYLDRQRWPWIPRVSFAIDRLVLLEERPL